MHFQILLYDGFDPLDAVAPFEVLTAGSDAVGGDLTVSFVSAEGPRRVASGNRGLALEAGEQLDPERPGYVVVPGVVGPLPTIPALLARFGATRAAPLIRRALDHPEITVATVCGGSLALAMAGLLEGRHAVTHVQGMEALAATGVHAVDARVVDDGDLISGGGVTSGLDVGLYLLEREFGPQIARAVETLFQYERRGVVWHDRGRRPVAV